MKTQSEIDEFKAIARYIGILLIMNYQDKPLTATEISRYTGRNLDTTSRHLNKLRELKRVRKISKLWLLTQKGRELIPGLLFYISTDYPKILGSYPQVTAENHESIAENQGKRPKIIHKTPKNEYQTTSKTSPKNGVTAENHESIAENHESIAEIHEDFLSTGPTKTTININRNGDEDDLIALASTITKIDDSCPYKFALNAVKTAFIEGDSISEISDQFNKWIEFCNSNNVPEKAYSVAKNIMNGDKIS